MATSAEAGSGVSPLTYEEIIDAQTALRELRDEQILALHDAGKSQRWIGEKFGLTHSMVGNVIRARREERASPIAPGVADILERVRAAVASRPIDVASPDTVAREEGIARTDVYRWLKRGLVTAWPVLPGEFASRPGRPSSVLVSRREVQWAIRKSYVMRGLGAVRGGIWTDNEFAMRCRALVAFERLSEQDAATGLRVDLEDFQAGLAKTFECACGCGRWRVKRFEGAPRADDVEVARLRSERKTHAEIAELLRRSRTSVVRALAAVDLGNRYYDRECRDRHHQDRVVRHCAEPGCDARFEAVPSRVDSGAARFCPNHDGRRSAARQNPMQNRQHWAKAVRGLMRRMGPEARRHYGRKLGGSTPRLRRGGSDGKGNTCDPVRVAELAAAGLAPKEIAAELTVSTWQVYRVLSHN